jgi:hypothetical protein
VCELHTLSQGSALDAVRLTPTRWFSRQIVAKPNEWGVVLHSGLMRRFQDKMSQNLTAGGRAGGYVLGGASSAPDRNSGSRVLSAAPRRKIQCAFPVDRFHDKMSQNLTARNDVAVTAFHPIHRASFEGRWFPSAIRFRFLLDLSKRRSNQPKSARFRRFRPR